MRFAIPLGFPLAGVLASTALLACSSPGDSVGGIVSPRFNNGNGVEIATHGQGVVDLSTAATGNADFSFNAKLKNDGTVKGSFRMSRVRNGLLVEFEGDVTCTSVDAALGRARIGGVITKNNSTDPAFMTINHEVGDDVWFRVQDGGEGQDAVDASTTLGFKPTLVNTSAEYCALPFTGLPAWNPASIFPLSHGNIQVRP